MNKVSSSISKVMEGAKNSTSEVKVTVLFKNCSLENKPIFEEHLVFSKTALDEYVRAKLIKVFKVGHRIHTNVVCGFSHKGAPVDNSITLRECLHTPN